MEPLENKKVKMSLIGFNNVSSMVGAFKTEAKLQGWTEKEIKTVIDKCMNGVHDYLFTTLMEYIDTKDIDEYDNDFDNSGEIYPYDDPGYDPDTGLVRGPNDESPDYDDEFLFPRLS